MPKLPPSKRLKKKGTLTSISGSKDTNKALTIEAIHDFLDDMSEGGDTFICCAYSEKEQQVYYISSDNNAILELGIIEAVKDAIKYYRRNEEDEE